MGATTDELTNKEGFLAALRQPPGGNLPAFGTNGWEVSPGQDPFVSYADAIDVNWSDELETLHEESSRNHFLDVATRRAVLAGVRPSVPRGGVIADVGCSTGYLLENLRETYPDALLVGIDLVAAGLRNAHALVPEAALIVADVCDLPIGDDTVNAIVSANVLEHVADDVSALRELHRVLVPDGRAALVVPAGAGLYDYYDRFLEHERRYRRGEMAGKAKAAGFDVVQDTFIGSLVYPAFWFVKKSNRIKHRMPSAQVTEQLVKRDIGRTENSRLGSFASAIEQRLLDRGLKIPFGIRSLTVVQKRETP